MLSIDEKKRVINVCLAFDDKYVFPALTLLASIMVNSSKEDHYAIYVLDGGITYPNKKVLMNLSKMLSFDIHFIQIDKKDFANCPIPEKGHFALSNYFRLKIPSLLPNIEKIIYLDSDTLVKRNLRDLYKTDISDYHLAAVESFTSEKNKKRLKLQDSLPYFNSGVILINCEKWRKDKVEKKLFDFIYSADLEQLLNVDQDVINCVLRNSILPLLQNWNVETRTDVDYPDSFSSILENPYIIHYCSKDKPWLEDTKQDKSEFEFYSKIVKEQLKKFKDSYDLTNLKKIKVNKFNFDLFSMPNYIWKYTDIVFEEMTALFMRQMAEGIKTFVDVGAHYGFYSILVGKSNPAVNILAFEPIPENYQVLTKNLKLNDIAGDTYKVALSNKEGQNEFQVSAQSSQSGFIANPDEPVIKTINVNTVRLDQYKDSIKEGPILVKIDTEGHELSVLEGMTEIIREAEDIRLVIEFNPACLQANHIGPKEFFKRIQDLGFEIYVIYDVEQKFKKIEDFSDPLSIMGERTYRNLYCVKKEHSISLCLFLLTVDNDVSLSLLKGAITRLGSICTVVLPTGDENKDLFLNSGIAVITGDLNNWCSKQLVLNQKVVNQNFWEFSNWILQNYHELEDLHPDIYLSASHTNPWGAISAYFYGLPHIWLIDDYNDNEVCFISKQQIFNFIKQSSEIVFTNSKILCDHLNSSQRKEGETSKIIYSENLKDLDISLTLMELKNRKSRDNDSFSRFIKKQIFSLYETKKIKFDLEISKYKEEIENLSTELEKQQQILNKQLISIKQQKREIVNLSESVAEKNLKLQNLRTREEETHKLSACINRQEQEIRELSFMLSQADRDLQQITGSKAWKLVLFLRRIRKIVIPKNSLLEQVLKKTYHGIKKPISRLKRNRQIASNLSLIRSSDLFNSDWYLAQNPDVKNNSINPAMHYLKFGGFEGRDPGPKFSSKKYLELNEDVNKAKINPLLHYLLFGQKEGRSTLNNENLSLKKKKEHFKSGSVFNQYKAIYTKNLHNSNREKLSEFVNYTQYNFNQNSLPVKLIAFYLPQYHPIKENDEWWGKGFTEWRNVVKGVPNFVGHYQPHIPGELGFYDLRIPEVQEQQIKLARNFGVYGFCFYYYWFSGKRLLDRPIFQYLNNQDLDFPFCLCWANENWTRTWDGANQDILIEQKYKTNDVEEFIRDISPFLKDNRYIKVDGKPLLLIYRVNEIPDPKEWSKRIRIESRKLDIGELCLAAVQSFGIKNPHHYGMDIAVEFPPHHLGEAEIDSKTFKIINQEFSGKIFDYKKATELMINKEDGNYTLYKTIMPSWDNTARRQNNPHIFVNSNPEAFQKWLFDAINYSRSHNKKDQNIVFVNAWNEWAEAAYLEPDQWYGYAYLDKIAKTLKLMSRRNQTIGAWKILFIAHDAVKAGAQLSLLNILRWFNFHTNINTKILLLKGGELLSSYQSVSDVMLYKDIRDLSIEKRIEKIIAFCEGKPALIYANSTVSGKVFSWINKLDVPIVTHVREMGDSINRYANDWIADILKYSSKYFFCSDAVQKYFLQKHNIEPEESFVLYSFIESSGKFIKKNSDEIKEHREMYGIEKDKFIIFGCGVGMPYRKGADLFIDTIAKLRQKNIEGFHAYWIGEFDSTEQHKNHGLWQDHLDRIEKENLGDYVTFLGTKDNPRDYFNLGDLFLLTSREEPLGRVVLEAADCGLPIICFDNSGGGYEFVKKCQNISVPFENTEIMAEKVNLLMKEKELRLHMGLRASRLLNDQYSSNKIGPQILSHCRKIAQKKPAVSIILTSYNHEKYLKKRLESIFNQTFLDFEVIMLDDASKDGSVNILREYEQYLNVQLIVNRTNSGKPISQWFKGLELAKSDLIWIAESDDYCELDFLEQLIDAFQDPEVKLAYSCSNIVNEEDIIRGSYDQTRYLKSLSVDKWNSTYCVDAQREINDGLGIKNTILNMSSMLFKRFDMDEEFKNTILSMSSSGDTFFILNAIRDGKVFYNASRLNYHRRHSQSIVGKLLVNKNPKEVERFFRNHLVNYSYVIDNYELESGFLEKFDLQIQTLWKQFGNEKDINDLEKFFPLSQLRKRIQNKINQ